MSKNPHNIPLEKIVYKRNTGRYENPLKVVIGDSPGWHALDGRPFLEIGELCKPTRVTYHCHPDNFKPIGNLAKKILLGEVTGE